MMYSQMFTSLILVSMLFSTAYSQHLCPVVTPIAECQRTLGNGNVRIWWSYDNNDVVDIAINIGNMNQFIPAPYNRGQPSLFLPGLHENVFRITVDPTELTVVQWKLQVTGVPVIAVADLSVLPNCTGACCLIEDQVCMEITEDECDTYSPSDWQGVNTECENSICGIPMGACCLEDNTCVVSSQSQCRITLDGIYQGTNKTCSLGCGACCGCLDNCGDQRSGELCLDNPPTTFYPGQSCANLTESCPFVGACCAPNGTCINSLTLTECEIVGGVFQGICSVCEDGTCLLPPTFPPLEQPTAQPTPQGVAFRTACCFESNLSGHVCVDLPPLACELSFGNSAPRGFLCSDIVCGSCCECDGFCLDDIPSTDMCNSTGGIWSPDECDNSPPCVGNGACCTSPEITRNIEHTNNAEQLCLDDLTETQCATLVPPGIYQGNCTTCANTVCIA